VIEGHQEGCAASATAVRDDPHGVRAARMTACEVQKLHCTIAQWWLRQALKWGQTRSIKRTRVHASTRAGGHTPAYHSSPPRSWFRLRSFGLGEKIAGEPAPPHCLPWCVAPCVHRVVQGGDLHGWLLRKPGVPAGAVKLGNEGSSLTVKLMPPPALWTSTYVAPASFIFISWQRSPLNTAWVWASTNPGRGGNRQRQVGMRHTRGAASATCHVPSTGTLESTSVRSPWEYQQPTRQHRAAATVDFCVNGCTACFQPCNHGVHLVRGQDVGYEAVVAHKNCVIHQCTHLHRCMTTM
jgi:hypothetical protein